MAEGMNCLNNEDEIDSLLDNIDHINSDMEFENQIGGDLEKVVEVTHSYKGKETKDITVEVDNNEKTISATLARIKYDSIYEFPSVGSESLIYIDKSTMTMYLWDNASFKYERLASDWTNIEQINGGNA